MMGDYRVPALSEDLAVILHQSSCRCCADAGTRRFCAFQLRLAALPISVSCLTFRVKNPAG